MNYIEQSQAVNASILPIGTNDFSLSLWYKPNSITSAEWEIFYLGGSIGYIAQRYRHILMVFGSTQYYWLTSMPNDTNWHHIAITADRDGVAKLYIDGVKNATENDISAKSAVNSGNGVQWGYTPGGGIGMGSLYDCKMAIGTIWSLADIQAQYANPLTYTGVGTLTEYWGFQEGSGTTITAGVTSPTNNLTLASAAAWRSTTQIKKIGGIAYASIKKVGGVAISSIKKLGGVQ